ncbi:TonB-dependent receptor [Fretibacter rubidus]|uniref:TonB-dependent receptor n=1 Tax=Fretibacter rubidus TaxID=570162 RepID=UPI00352BBA58
MTKTHSIKRAYFASAAGIALTLALGTSAIAQDVEQLEDEVVATGIRQSIADSLRVKRESSSIVEAITAEDIGKLPDVSIADSLARLPGVTAQRVRGRAQTISIRGLGPDFSIALLNGREQVSAGNNRGIEFDQFPSELIAQGIVYKTPDAKLATTGVAGAVDLKTVRPLDYNERKLTASAKYVINDNDVSNPDFGSDGYRLFGSYIDQNVDGTIGWSVGVTHQSNPTQILSRELKSGPGQTQQLADGTYYAADNPRSGVVSRDFKRTSVAGALQFEPTDRFSATFDGYYSDFADEGIFRGVETPLASWSGNQLVSSTGSGSFVDSATYAPAGAIVRTDTEGNSAEIYSLGANFNFEVSDKINLTLDAATSNLKKSDIDYESYAGTGRGVFGSSNPNEAGTLVLTTPENGEYSFDSSIDYSNPSNVLLTDPGGWGQVGFIKEPKIKDELNQLRFEAEYELGKSGIEAVAAGILYTDREKDFNSNENFVRPGAGFVNGSSSISDVLGSTDSGNLGLDVVAYDPSALIENGTYFLDPAADVLWNVQEEILTYYAMATIDSEGPIPVRGNFGFQYVDVTQSSSAGALFIEDSYGDFLPSLNLSFEVKDDTFLRFGAAQSVTRPRMDQLRTNDAPGLNTVLCPDADADGIPDTYIGEEVPQVNQTCVSIFGGNPLLRPYKSTGLDVAVEKYFSDAGAISLAFFTKTVRDYIQDSSEIVDAGNVVSALYGDGFVNANPGVQFVSVGGPLNVEEATLKGMEASIRLPLSDIFDAPFFEGFGLNAAYTYTDNNLEFEGRDIAIPGYSKNTFSGDIYYENHGWRARLNSRYRSGFRSEVQQFDGGLIGADALDEFIVDAQIGYEWEDGPLAGVSVNVEASNLTDEPFRTENDLDGNGPGTDTFISRREDYGRTYNFTISKTF